MTVTLESQLGEKLLEATENNQGKIHRPNQIRGMKKAEYS